MDRYWLLTWTTYGSWLPGDRRGLVGQQMDATGTKCIHNIPGTAYDPPDPRLHRAMSKTLKAPPVRLNAVHALSLRDQLIEVAEKRGWRLFAVSVMANHVHLVLAVPGDPEPSGILRDFKSYGSRRLNNQFGPPASGTWWTESGSKRKLPNDDAVLAAGKYVRDQEFPLLVWLDPQIAPELANKGVREV
jgi:REP element-mobilizing transposase RayT